jgi:hypothetical protein
MKCSNNRVAGRTAQDASKAPVAIRGHPGPETRWLGSLASPGGLQMLPMLSLAVAVAIFAAEWLANC